MHHTYQRLHHTSEYTRVQHLPYIPEITPYIRVYQSTIYTIHTRYYTIHQSTPEYNIHPYIKEITQYIRLHQSTTYTIHKRDYTIHQSTPEYNIHHTYQRLHHTSHFLSNNVSSTYTINEFFQ